MDLIVGKQNGVVVAVVVVIVVLVGLLVSVYGSGSGFRSFDNFLS